MKVFSTKNAEKRMMQPSTKKLPDSPNEHSQSLTLRDILLISLWSGLVTGILEVLIQVYRKFGLNYVLGLGLDFIWMTPLAEMLVFLAVGMLFFPYAKRFARANNIRLLVFILAFLSAFSAVQFLPIHWFARDILTLGLAVVCANAVQNSGNRLILLAQRTIPALVAVVVLSGIGLHVYKWNEERREIANLTAGDPAQPNILLIVMDTVRAENLSLYGYERDTTPALRELAQEGVVFEQAFSTAPWTLPSHSSMFTGHWPHELGADYGRFLDDTYPTLAEVLKGRGYQTAAFVGNNVYVSYEHGLNRGFIHFEDYVFSLGQLFLSSAVGRNLVCTGEPYNGCPLRILTGYYQNLGRKDAQEVNRETLKWIANAEQRPYFIFINYFDAHAPYLPPVPFDTVFDPKRPPFKEVYIGALKAWDGTSEETQREENAYDELILFVDHQIGELLSQLRSQGRLENTLVIITADHGEEFQEHGVMGHGNSLYRPSVQVPLMMIFPDHIPAGERVQKPISLRNIPATALDILGLANASPFPGYSLVNSMANPGDTAIEEDELILNESSQTGWRPSFYPIFKGDMKSIVNNGLRYILNGDGSEELYDFVNDPQETNDLAGTTQGQAALPQYRTLLQDILAQSNPALHSAAR